MNKTELGEILRLHDRWLSGLGGARADLRGAFLFGADLSDVNLCGANLSRADLRDAVLTRASLRGAILTNANLSNANLGRTDLSQTILRRASLRGAILSRAILSRSDLSNADFSGSINGPAYYSISWSGHGQRGRRLHAVEQDGRLAFSCGCFSGSESDLREYIEEGNRRYAESRLQALEVILELHEGAVK